MCDLMPKEQAEFIDELQRWFHESTNMCHEDCYRFAFVIWQHSDKLSQMLGCQQGREERAKVLKEQYNKGRESAFKEIAYSEELGLTKESEYEKRIRADERVKMHKEMMARREDNLVVIRKDGLDRLIAKAMEDAVERNEMYHRSKHTRPCCFCGKFHDIFDNVPYFEAFGNRIYVCDECFEERIQSKDRFIQVEYMSAYHYGLDLPIYDENSNKIYERKEADKQ